MNTDNAEFKAEKAYLDSVVDFLTKEISELKTNLESKKKTLYNARREQGILVSDVTSAGMSSDLSQHLLEDERQLASIEALTKRLIIYERLYGCPYFGRFDFLEDGEDSADKIYVGLNNVYDSSSGDIMVYDWRAPISSMFYQSDDEKANFTAPSGKIEGSIKLKRQYEIENAKLKYFFDCSLYISDDILKEVLSKNASKQMQNIVRTIQSEQDKIIRNNESDLLVAQGAAGSGKTTIALHRIAYLLYDTAKSGLTSDNIIIISLNDIFGKYISTVLPSLGERNVKETTFETVAERVLGITSKTTKAAYVNSLINASLTDYSKAELLHNSYLFKGSHSFAEVLNRFIKYFEANLIKFDDVVYDGKVIAKASQIKKLYLENSAEILPFSRLRRIENILKSKIDIVQKIYHQKLQEEFMESEEHKLDYKSAARYKAIKETNRVVGLIERFTVFSATDVYNKLFSDKKLFLEMCQGLDIPDNIDEILDYTKVNIEKGIVGYDDIAPILYTSLLLDKTDSFEGVKHVVVDEAQDYLPIHYAVFGILFKNASFTVLGDIGQAVETVGSDSIYDEVEHFIKKRKPLRLTLKKSYRCSYEIMSTALKLNDNSQVVIPFERHEEKPSFIKCAESEEFDKLAEDIKLAVDQGFSTIAVVCLTEEKTKEMFDKLRTKLSLSLIDNTSEIGHGVSVIPAYLSKGLEFDCVFIPDLSDENYSTEISKRLLYIAATRALHRLSFYYSKESNITKLLKD